MRVKRTGSGPTVGWTCALAVIAAAGCARSTPQASSAPEPETVAVGYGTESEARVTGAVASVAIGEADTRGAARVEELLAGRVAGVEVIRTATGFSLQIRGVTSLHGDSEPLVVIDGMPVSQLGAGSALAGLSPHDVARIDVLKDAGSTAIYGSRGANGVILITTRRAR